MERHVLLKTVRWLSGTGPELSVSDDIGNGTELGPARVEFVVNGGAEKGGAPGELPSGWQLDGKGDKIVSLSVSTNARSGKHSIRWRMAAVDPGETAVASHRLPLVFNGSWEEPDNVDLHAVIPDSKYSVSFWLTGDPDNKTRPALTMWFKTWLEDQDTPENIRYQKSIVAPGEWTRYSFDFLPRLGNVGKGCFLELQLTPGEAGEVLHPNSTVYIDDLSVTRTYAGVPKDVSFEKIRDGCEQRITVDWADAMSQKALALHDIPPGVPLEFADATERLLRGLVPGDEAGPVERWYDLWDEVLLSRNGAYSL